MEKVRTICCDCHSKCGAIVHVEDGKIVKVEGDPNHPVSKGMFCCKGLSAAQIHDDPNRLQYPMKRVGPRGSGKWERISWDEAYGIIMDNMRTITDKYGANAFVISQGTGRQTNHFHFRLNNTYGHPGWGMTPTHVCLMPNLIPTLLTYGFFGFIDAADIPNSGCAVLWGVNSFASWPGTQGRHVLEAKANGTKIIVVDPRFTDLAAKADLWMQLRPGTDLALALALTHVVIAEDLYDHDFVDKWCYGFDELAASVEEYTAEWAEIITGVSAAKIVEMACMIATERPSNVTPSLGASMHENGMQTGRAICNLFAILGDLDAKGGLLSNKFWDYMLADEITLQTPEAGAKMKTLVGYDRKPFLLDMAAVPFPHAMWDAMKSDYPYPIKGFVCLAHDPAMAYENTSNVVEGISNLDFFCIKDYYPHSMIDMADLVLPSAHWTERDGQFDEELYADPCPFVVGQRAVDPPGEAIDDWEFCLELGKRIDPSLWPWNDVKEMQLWRAKTFYGIEDSWDEAREKGYYVTYGGENRQYKKYESGLEREDGQLGFRTSTGRIELYNAVFEAYGYTPLPQWVEPTIYHNDALAADYPLILITGGRLYEYYHSGWTNIPLQREIDPDPFCEIHPDAAAARGISEGDWVKVAAPEGREISVKARITRAVLPDVVHIPRPGWKHACEALSQKGYGYREANPNVLIPAEPCEPHYGTPPMRSWRCEVRKEA